MAIVGQYQGLDGAAFLALVSPIWNIIYSLGLLMVLVDLFYFLLYVEKSKSNQDRSNEYFSAAIIGVTILAFIFWVVIIFFDT